MRKSFGHGRHSHAFVLMQIAKKSGYGLDILKRLDNEMPHQIFDSAAVYRSLQYLEDMGAIESEWDTSEKGAAKKNYSITPQGLDLLKEFYEDIQIRMSVLKYLNDEIKTILED